MKYKVFIIVIKTCLQITINYSILIAYKIKIKINMLEKLKQLKDKLPTEEQFIKGLKVATLVALASIPTFKGIDYAQTTYADHQADQAYEMQVEAENSSQMQNYREKQEAVLQNQITNVDNDESLLKLHELLKEPHTHQESTVDIERKDEENEDENLPSPYINGQPNPNFWSKMENAHQEMYKQQAEKISESARNNVREENGLNNIPWSEWNKNMESYRQKMEGVENLKHITPKQTHGIEKVPVNTITKDENGELVDQIIPNDEEYGKEFAKEMAEQEKIDSQK